MPAIADGNCATMPDRMISEMPLPMPREVICSPSHIRNMVPPVSVMVVEIRKKSPGSTTTLPVPSQADGDAVGLERRQHHGEIARVLVHDLAARLAFLLERFERGRHRRHQLNDDRGRDVRHDVEREDRHPVDAAAGEHVEHAEDAAGLRTGRSAPRPSGRCRAAGYRCRAGRPAARRRVNQMRFLSSSALASAAKLRLAASCSAAETIARSCRAPPRQPPAAATRDRLTPTVTGR